MSANESERDSATWLEDLAGSAVPGKEMASGLFRMNKGPTLQYTYTYEEIKYIVRRHCARRVCRAAGRTGPVRNGDRRLCTWHRWRASST
jgi:hypothetical protein